MGQLNAITTYITQLLTQHVGEFSALGQSMFVSFAIIMVVWFGVKAWCNAFHAANMTGRHATGRA